MNIKRSLAHLCILLGLVLAAGAGSSVARAGGLRQTIPTRTPTPAPQPSSTSEPSDNGQNTPTPSGQASTLEPTSTPPGTTPIASSTPIELAPTPIGGYLPTAEPCGEPMLQVFSGVNARSGPSTDYTVVYLLVYLEVRPIVGRAAASRWWQIILPDGRQAWVADSVAALSGNYNTVPIVESPPLNGATATPGPQWNPINTGCALSATSTPLPSPTTSPTTASVQQATATGTPLVNLEPTTTTGPTIASLTPTDEASLGPELSATVAESRTPAPTAITESSTSQVRQDPTSETESEVAQPLAPDPVPLDPPAEAGSSGWLLYGGVALMLFGAILYVVMGRRQ